MTLALSPAVVSDRLQALTRQLDLHPTLPGRLLVYGGARPASGATPSGALLATATFPKPSLNAVTGSQLTLLTPPMSLAQSSGLATWARLANGAGQWVADMDAGVDGDAGVELLIRKANGAPALTAQLYAGGEFTVSLARLSEV